MNGAKIWTAIGGLLAALPALIPKKKPFVLWYWYGSLWVKQGGPFSYRQCRKTRAQLIAMGMKPSLFVILRNGVTPPKEGPQYDGC